jgi:hypothetical protein
MNGPVTRRLERDPRLLVAAVLALFVSGCSQELGPVRFATTTVSGSVVEGKQKVTGGWIEFIPVEGTVGDLRSARIQTDGTFRATRVAVGQNALRIVSAPLALRGAAQLFGRFNTPVRRHIPEQPEGALRVDLFEEAVRYQTTRPRPPSTSSARVPGAEP